MDKCDVVDMFYKQDKVCYGKDYKLFEDTYEELKDVLDLIKEDKGDYVIVRPRKTKLQQIKGMLDEMQVYENQETAIKLLEENVELKTRIRKAIEYINTHEYPSYFGVSEKDLCKKDLKEILVGRRKQ